MRHRRAASDRAASGATQLALDAVGTPLVDTTFVALDLETTGLSPERDRITEIGAVKVRGGEVLGELRTFVHPGCPIPPAITALTGIADATVADAPSIEAVLPTVLRFLDDAVLVAHNAGFDVSFLRAAALRTGWSPPDVVVVDTVRLSRRLLHDEVRDHRLATLAAHLRTPRRPDHRALSDARATVDVLHALLERAGSHGATTLEDLRDLASSRSDRSYRRRGMVAQAPTRCGVYRFVDARGELLYVGKATDLRARLRTYFGQDPRRRIADMVREAAAVHWDVTPTLLEAEVRELRLLHTARPRYNRRSTRPEAAVHVALTNEPLPRLSVVRAPGRGHLVTIGPLPSRRVATAVVEAFEVALPIRPCTPRLRAAQDHAACVLKQIDRCAAPCDGTISRDAYAVAITPARDAGHDPTAVLAALRSRMEAQAQAGRYEQAQRLRDALHVVARALAGAREHAMLGDVASLVAARRIEPAAAGPGRGAGLPDTGTEVVRIERGRLVRTAFVPDVVSDATLLRAVGDPVGMAAASSVGAAGAATDEAGPDGGLGTPPPGPPHPEDAEEVALLAAWLRRPGVRLLAVEGTLAMPTAGGALLAATAAEQGLLGRRLREDRQVLSGSKVVRRVAGSPTSTMADTLAGHDPRQRAG